MTTLVGWEDAGNTATTGVDINNNNGEAAFFTAGYVAVASGTATSAWVKCNASGSGQFIVAIYDNSGNLLSATTAQLGVGSGVNGWNELTGLSQPITSGQTYKLALLAEFSLSVFEDSGSSGSVVSRSTGAPWSTPDSSIASGYSGIAAREFPIYLSGTSSSPVLMGQAIF